MKQAQYSPQSVAEMGVVLYAANQGHLKTVEINKIGDFEASLLSYMKSEHTDLMNEVDSTGSWSADIQASFKAALDKFVATQTW